MTMPYKPGRYFSWSELTWSATATKLGIDNSPTDEHRTALVMLCAQVLDPLRLDLGRPVHVSSGYRSAALNNAIKGSTRSQHMKGEAADIKVTGMAAEELAAHIVALGLPFDQVIWYDPERGGHVHVSHSASRPNRGQTLHAPARGGYVAWQP